MYKKAKNATIIGDVKIGNKSSVWYGAVLRGDIEKIEIGSNSNVQDNVVIHTNKGCPCVIGNNVSIGHNATIHGAIIEDNCLIGMGAVLLDGCKISKGSLVAAGAVVPQGMVIGTRSLVMGCPAKVVTEVDDAHYKTIIDNANEYSERKNELDEINE